VKNKKLLLSVLSTALVSSMTSAAFAHPQAGVYIGGEVAKFYSLDAFMSDVNFDDALELIIEDPNLALFVDERGYVANIYDLLTLENVADALHFGTEEDFDALGALDGFTPVDENGEEGDIYDPILDLEDPEVDSIEITSSGDNVLTVGDANDSSLVLSAVAYDAEGNELDAEFTFETSNAAVATVTAEGKVEAKGAGEATITVKAGEVTETYLVKVNPAAELQVLNVKALNAKQLQVNFNKAIDKDTVVVSGGGQNVFVQQIGGSTVAVAAELSADAKSLVLSPTSGSLSGDYAVTVANTVLTAEKEAVKPFSTIVNVKDEVRPTLVGEPEAVDFQTFKLVFSEPLQSAGEVKLSHADATADLGNISKGYITINLANVPEKTDVSVTVIGAKDYAGNLLTPNPITKTVSKVKTDNVLPAVVNVAALSNSVFTVTVSEKLRNAPTVKIGTTTLTIPTDATYTVSADGLVYTYTLVNALSNGIHDVVVSGVTDISGNNAAKDHTQIVRFAADTTKPTLVGSPVIDVKDGEERLAVTFSEDVVIGGTTSVTITGKREANYVETPISSVPVTPVYKDASNKKVIIVPLSHAELTPAGKYSVSLTFNNLADAATNAVDQVATVEFDRKGNVDLGKPQLDSANGSNGIAALNNNEYTVAFDRKLDVTSALNLSNYNIEGVTVTKAIFTKNDETGAVVKLTVNSDSIQVTGDRQVIVQNVKSANGVAMDKVTTIETIKENVAPTLVDAKLTSTTTFTLTFSEKLDGAFVADGNADFAVFVDGTDITASLTPTTVTEGAVGTTGTVYELVLNRSLTDAEFSKKIEIRKGSGFNIVDEAGNALNFATKTVKEAQ